MKALVKTDTTGEVAMSNMEQNFLYHPSLWAEVTEHPNGRIHQAYSGKPGEPLKKKLTSFENKYWEQFGWKVDGYHFGELDLSNACPQQLGTSSSTGGTLASTTGWFNRSRDSPTAILTSSSYCYCECTSATVHEISDC